MWCLGVSKWGVGSRCGVWVGHRVAFGCPVGVRLGVVFGCVLLGCRV